MAFVFTVEDGTGLPDANSYVSVEEADDILAVNIHTAGIWGELEDEDKEKLLAWASRFLDEKTRWFGTIVSANSGLRWPRRDVTNRDGLLILPNEIPRQLKIATAEMARYLASSDRTVEREQDALKRLKADVIELEFNEGYKIRQVPEHMPYLVAGLGALSSGNGIKFKRLIK